MDVPGGVGGSNVRASGHEADHGITTIGSGGVGGEHRVQCSEDSSVADHHSTANASNFDNKIQQFNWQL